MIEMKSGLQKWSRKAVAKKCELQSILSQLLWVSRAVRFRRVFASRIIAEVRKLKKPSDKTTLSPEIRKDFLWSDRFLVEFSGVEIMPAPTDSLAVYGGACVRGGSLFKSYCASDCLALAGLAKRKSYIATMMPKMKNCSSSCMSFCSGSELY